MADPVEQTDPTVQDPAVQPQQESAPVAPQQPGPAPWSTDLQQAFNSPEEQARVDAFLRAQIQPRMTQMEQELASARDAQQMYDAFNQDPDAANIALQRQFYGDEYADQLAAALGRTDQMSAPQAAPQAPAPQQQYQQPAPPQEPQEPQGRPGDPVYDYWAEKYQEEQYDAAKSSFLSDPQYADIDAELFDPFVAGAETWEEAVSRYRAYASHFNQSAAPAEQPPPPPPTLGNQVAGAPGSTPSLPQNESLNDAIDAIFTENTAPAPPTLGSQ